VSTAVIPTLEHSSDRLTADDQALVATVATLLLDVVPAFSEAATRCIHEHVPSLPRDDDDSYASLQAVARAGPRELLTTLRAGMPASAHETPVEMLAHARYVKRRGLGLRSLMDVYQVGFPLFRNVVRRELEERARDRAQFERVAAAADDYAFAFIGTALARQAVEFGSHDGGWTPAPGDAALDNEPAAEAARTLRSEQIANGTWVRACPEESRARRQAECALDVFAATIERGVSEHDISRLLMLADTTLTVTLADEPDLSLTALLDRNPVEVLDGESETETRMWIASVDLERVWSPDFYLPMAITKGRVRMEGPLRKFLRVVPMLRELAGVHEQVAAAMNCEEAGDG
jgi:hypothetical protein